MAWSAALIPRHYTAAADIVITATITLSFGLTGQLLWHYSRLDVVSHTERSRTASLGFVQSSVTIDTIRYDTIRYDR